MITFLMTDVAGSTRQWATDPAWMGDALIRHDSMVEDSVTSSGGTVVRPRGEGDSRFAVFSDAAAALHAAVRIQRGVAREWPEPPRSLKLRIAVHTGKADPRDGDYYGHDVNVCARLRAIGHPGQTLVSSTSRRWARRRLPDGVSLDDAGVHRLRDVPGFHRVFVVRDELQPVVAPPVRSPEDALLELARYVFAEA